MLRRLDKISGFKNRARASLIRTSPKTISIFLSSDRKQEKK